MKDDIEKRIIAAQPLARGKSEFVARTMLAVKQAKTRETFFHALRNTNMTKKSLLTKLKHLPGIMVAAIVIGALLFVSGTAYAAYKLWLSPGARIKSVEQKFGRDQALIDMKNCNSYQGKVQVEINDDKSGSPDEAAKGLVAHCEIEAIQSWAIKDLSEDPSSVLFPFTINDIKYQQVSVSNPYKDTRTFNLNDATPIVFKGDIVKLSSLSKGDAVAIVVSGPKKELRALVKLSYPVRYYYSPNLQNSYHTRHECYGNPNSSCINLPSLDVLRDGEGGANPDTRGEARLIQGRLTSYTETQFKLQSTSGEIYTVYTSTNIMGIFNAGNPYGDIMIEKDDVLEVRYSQTSGDNPKEIQPTQYHTVQLLLQEFDTKAETNFNKYHY